MLNFLFCILRFAFFILQLKLLYFLRKKGPQGRSVFDQYPMAAPSHRGSDPPMRRPFSGWIKMPWALPMD